MFCEKLSVNCNSCICIQEFEIRETIFRSGKTAAFAIPILQALLETPQKLFALVLTPTRELAFQIGEQFEALGASIGILIGMFISIV